MDTAISDEQLQAVQRALSRYRAEGVHYHALRTRRAGRRNFVSVHVLVPGTWSVQAGHKLLERIERDIRNVVTNATVFTHLEPLEDPVSWQDIQLDRGAEPER
jgi:divalent metal cation (Fe/Co/Zn/Cd) transporter